MELDVAWFNQHDEFQSCDPNVHKNIRCSIGLPSERLTVCRLTWRICLLKILDEWVWCSTNNEEET